MSTDETPKVMRLVKDVQMPTDAETEILAKIEHFQQTYLQKPHGILLGPNHYLAIVKAFREKWMGGNPDVRDKYPGSIKNIEIIPKMSQGVDFILAPQQVYMFATGAIRDEY